MTFYLKIKNKWQWLTYHQVFTRYNTTDFNTAYTSGTPYFTWFLFLAVFMLTNL